MNQNFERAFQLSGQVALITGGGSGLGYATAKCMAAAGAVVVIMGRREEVLQKACAELGDTVHYIVHDITDVSAAQTVIDRIVRDYRYYSQQRGTTLQEASRGDLHSGF